jgi:hypothetical protein
MIVGNIILAKDFGYNLKIKTDRMAQVEQGRSVTLRLWIAFLVASNKIFKNSSVGVYKTLGNTIWTRLFGRNLKEFEGTRIELPSQTLDASRAGSSSHGDVDLGGIRSPMAMNFGYDVEDIRVHLLVKFRGIWLGGSPGTPMPIWSSAAERESSDVWRRL